MTDFSALSGLFCINKPSGLTSRAVVDEVIRLLRFSGEKAIQRKGPGKIRSGHCGTLDPLASGVLVVCVGQATRLVLLVQEQAKTYFGQFRLGLRTDTDDITGTPLPDGTRSAMSVTRDELLALLPEFTGRIEQVPPRFSAVHVNGQRAYDLARKGQDVDLSARPVEVHRLELIAWNPPDFELRIECGSGTYVRSIGRDLGERLGCGATMLSLERTAIGPFRVEDAVPLAELTPSNLPALLRPLRDAVTHLASCVLTDDELTRVRTGRAIPLPETLTSEPDGKLVALKSPLDELLAVAVLEAANHCLKPHLVFADQGSGPTFTPEL